MKLNISAFKSYDKNYGWVPCPYYGEYVEIRATHNNPRDGGYVLSVTDNDDWVMNKIYATYEDIIVDFMALLSEPNIQIRSLESLGLKV